jgi:Fe-S cluster assembly protein SufD
MSLLQSATAPLEAAKERYLANFAQRDAQGETPWSSKLRQAALDSFAAQGLPSTRNEEWKYTDVRPIAELDACPASTQYLNGLATDGTRSFSFSGLQPHQLVLVNGRFASQLSHIGELPNGVTLGSLAEHIASGSELVQEHLGRYAVQTAPSPFTDLNTAFMQDGVFLHVPNGIEIETPIHLLFLSQASDGPTVAYPRNLIIVGAGSRVTLIEHYASTHGGEYLTNTVTEIVAGKNANIDHYKLQMESEAAFHVSTTQVQQERDVHFASHMFDFGGRLVRNNSNAVMGGENIECTLNGLYLIDGKQHVDNHTVMDHAMPHCNSYEVYTGVLSGASRGVFNGKIFVRRDAQKTDAKQSNRNLLLSNDALVNTKPQLEIFADDVRCTHGATIGQLDEDAEFYLRARGIDRESARGLLVYAFANEVLDGVRLEPLRAFLEQQIFTRLSRKSEPRISGQ